MAEQLTIEKPKNSESTRMLKAMVGIGAICALFIVLTYELTAPRIAKLKAEALKSAVISVLPSSTDATKAWIIEEDQLVLTDDAANATFYTGYDMTGKLTGLAIVASGQGYADQIKFLYGYQPYEEEAIGFYVLESKETPGLGDKIEKSPEFLQNFEGLDVKINEDQTGLENNVETVKSGEKNSPWQIDGITGATISSRAIGDAINKNANQLLPIIQSSLAVLEKGGSE